MNNLKGVARRPSPVARSLITGNGQRSFQCLTIS
jgi:hypothetical protein